MIYQVTRTICQEQYMSRLSNRSFKNSSGYPKSQDYLLLIIITGIYKAPFPKSCSKALNIDGLAVNNVDQTNILKFFF